MAEKQKLAIAVGASVEKIGNSRMDRDGGRYLQAGCVGKVVSVRPTMAFVMFPTWGRAAIDAEGEGVSWKRL